MVLPTAPRMLRTLRWCQQAQPRLQQARKPGPKAGHGGCPAAIITAGLWQASIDVPVRQQQQCGYQPAQDQPADEQEGDALSVRICSSGGWPAEERRG